MPQQLPPALQLLLPVLANDQGRGRARTLLFIAALDPDEVDKHIPRLDAALGSNSPGPAALAALGRAAREATSATAPRIRRQHVTSQVILRRYCEPGPRNAGIQLMRHDLLTGTATPKGPRGVGYVDNFVKIDSKATEDLWQQTENKLSRSIDAASTPAILSDPGLISLLRDAIALHYVRNPQTIEVHQQSFDDAFRNAVDALAGTPAADEAFRRRYGLEPAGPTARRLGAEELLARMKAIFTSGTLFRLRVQDLFEIVRERFQASGVEILTPADPGSEFIIGDTPALTMDYATGAAGVRAGISLAAANTVTMPLTPRLLVALGPATAATQAPKQFIDTINHYQTRAAQKYVYYRPNNTIGTGINAWRATLPPAFWPHAQASH
jgi:hypothetical protein